MGRTFRDWAHFYETETRGDDAAYVRLIILTKETRIPLAIQAFTDQLLVLFERFIAKGETEAAASRQALDEAINEIYLSGAALFLLPIGGSPFPEGLTHLTGRSLARFGTFGDIDSDSRAPKRLPISADEVFSKSKISVWFTPDNCADDPLEVARWLGLPHFEGEIVYRLTFNLVAVGQFVPSCLDAGLYAPWQEPPREHVGRCGLTRHLETGERKHNEFVVKTGDVRGQDVILVRLPGLGSVTRVGSMTPNYFEGR